MNTSYVTPGKPGISGAIYRAPAGTAVPTDASTPLSEAFKELGFVSEDGVSNENTAEKTEVYAWGGSQVMSTTDRKPDKFKFTLYEALNPEVLKVVYGDKHVDVSEDGKTITVTATSDDPDEFVLVIDMALKGGALKRIVIPKAELSNVAEIVYRDNVPIGYALTVAALPAGENGTHKEYIKLPGGATA